jgi:hypothetical protein
MTKHNLFDPVWAIAIAVAVLLLAVDAHAQTIPKSLSENIRRDYRVFGA